MITVDNSQGVSVITLVNYDKYNPISEIEEETRNGTASDTPKKLCDNSLHGLVTQQVTHPYENDGEKRHTGDTNKKKDKEYSSQRRRNAHTCTCEGDALFSSGLK